MLTGVLLLVVLMASSFVIGMGVGVMMQQYFIRKLLEEKRYE